MEVFYVIEKPMWQRSLLAFLIVVAVGLYYVVSKEQESSSPPGIDLVVFDEEAVPASGALLVAMPAAPEDPASLEPESTEEEAIAASGEAAALTQALGERSSALDAFRIARTVARSRRIEALEQSLGRADLTPATRDALQKELLALVEREEVEKQAEGLLVARGLADALVSITNQSAEVIVPEVIDREDAGRIGDLVARVAGVSLDRITIVDGARN